VVSTLGNLALRTGTDNVMPTQEKQQELIDAITTINNPASTAAQIQDATDKRDAILAEIIGQVPQYLSLVSHAGTSLTSKISPPTNTLRYSQAGARFSMSTVDIDFGLQYYYGYKSLPAFDQYAYDAYTATNIQEKLSAATSTEEVDKALEGLEPILIYNPFHQVGIDAAWSWGDLNFRGEAALNMTDDFKGTKPTVFNPNVQFCLGFDYTFKDGPMLLLQVSETLTLFNDKINRAEGSTDADFLYGNPLSSSNLMFVLTQSIKDTDLNYALIGIYMFNSESFEKAFIDNGFILMPTLSYSKGDFSASVSAQLMQGWQNNMIKTFGMNNRDSISLSLSYSF
jgi:hypothetical protein